MSNDSKKRVYLSGPMSGLPDLNKPLFDRAAQLLGQRRGWVVLNPAILPDGLTYAQYMAIDLTMLQQCQVIVMLEGWEQSNGAKAELAYAIAVGIEVFYWEGMAEQYFLK